MQKGISCSKKPVGNSFAIICIKLSFFQKCQKFFSVIVLWIFQNMIQHFFQDLAKFRTRLITSTYQITSGHCQCFQRNTLLLLQNPVITFCHTLQTGRFFFTATR